MWKDYVSSKEQILNHLKKKEWVHKNQGSSKRKGKEYLNVACAFDIETSNFVQEDICYGTMYIWQFAVDELFYYGRTWESFTAFIQFLVEGLELDESHILPIYVHNLSYEFQFIRRWFTWNDVFALKKLKPVKALTSTGVEFRCSLMLSGLSLEKTAENLQKHSIRKLVGDLDYHLARGRLTKLTDEEMEYCLNDVLIVTAYINEKIESDGDITRIPMTNTGYVREYCRKACLQLKDSPRKRNIRYVKIMKALTLSKETYLRLNQAFQGGFTHTNSYWVDQIVENVYSMDFTSSYPAVMIYGYFPMSNFVEVEPKESMIEYYTQNYCCLISVRFENLVSKQWENIISKSKCSGYDETKTVVNNGRIVCADSVNLTCTELDLEMYKKFYNYTSMKVTKLEIARRGYLPTEFVEAILTLYKDKTELKDVPEKAEEYLKSKGMLNSTYGMAVMKVIREMVKYTENGWELMDTIPVSENDEDEDEDEVELTDIEEQQIDKYNKSHSRFLFFGWGVWITAHARYNLFRGIIELGIDYIYSDTDSLKFVNYEIHKEWFEKYNKEVIQKLKDAMEYHGLSEDLLFPKTIKGETKPLGVWDYEGMYLMFKATGAKRYLTLKWNKKEQKNELTMTVAGCSKKLGSQYLLDNYGEEGAFEKFGIDMIIPESSSGRMIHSYSPEDQEEFSGSFEDYQGKINIFYEKSFVFLKDVPFTMNRSDEFKSFLTGVIMVEE